MRKQADNSKTKRYALDKVSDVKSLGQGHGNTNSISQGV